MPFRQIPPAGAGSRVPSCARIAFFLAACAVGPVRAATPVYADVAMTCAGLTPCFSTIQEAVDNAGPPPAFVGVFPGTYAESVDLSDMGSAIGGGPGDIAIQALDAAGQPATSGVLVDPGAAGGPGAGAGIISGLTMLFDGSVTIRGLALTSPDIAGLALQITGDVVLEDFLLEGAGTSGGIASAGGNARVARGLARLNGSAGLLVFALGNLEAEDVDAVRNTDSGVLLGAEGNAVISRVVSSLNLDGATLVACGTLDVNDVLTELNDEFGVFLFAGEDSCELGTSVKAGRFGAAFLDRLESGQPGKRRAKAVPPGFALGADGITSVNNGALGIGLAAIAEAADLRNVVSNDNGQGGLFGEVGLLVMSDGEFSRNPRGVFVLTDEAELTRITANGNNVGPLNGLFDHVGILVSADRAVLDELTAENNPNFGLLFGEMSDTAMPEYQVLDSRFIGNGQGVVAISETQYDVVLDQVRSSGNSGAGINLAHIRTGRMTRSTIDNNSLGVAFNVSEDLVVERSDIDGNDTGALLVVGAGASARVNCSNIRNNPDVGLRLLQGDAADARFNYWGAASGPTHPDNPGGSGDAVGDAATGDAGDVDYADFLGQAATPDDCPVIVATVQEVPVMGTSGRWLLVLGFLFVAVMSAGCYRRIA